MAFELTVKMVSPIAVFGLPEAEVQMGHHIADEDDGGVLHGIGQGGIRGSEESEYGLEENQDQTHEQQTYDGVEGDRVAQYLVGVFIVLLSQQDGNHGCRTHAHESSEGCAEVHQREGDSKG